MGFILSKRARQAMIHFEPVNDQMFMICLQGKFSKIIIINVYAPNEDTEEESVDMFYDTLQQMYDKVSKHNLLIVLGDFNAKIGQEEHFEKVGVKHLI